MRITSGLFIVLCLCLSAFAASAADAVEALLSTDPALEADKAFKAGDKRHIVVPVCTRDGGEAMPGWPLEGPTPPAMWVALREGRRPFQCSDLGEGTRSLRFIVVLKYAEQYNKKLLELERGM